MKVVLAAIVPLCALCVGPRVQAANGVPIYDVEETISYYGSSLLDPVVVRQVILLDGGSGMATGRKTRAQVRYAAE